MVNQTMKPVYRLLLLVGIWSLVPGVARAQWDSRPYQQWTVKEAEELLINSPWAQTRAGLVSVGRLDPPTDTVDTAVTVRLHSALPLRQALARLRQLKNKYDKKSERNKAAIDAKNKPLLECLACVDQYVATMSPGPGSSNGVPRFLQTMSLAVVKLNVHIKNEKGETRELVDFVRPKTAGEDAVFFFSRFNSKGEPLISPANRTLTISFDPRIFGWSPATLTKFEFDVAKMTVKGKVVF